MSAGSRDLPPLVADHERCVARGHVREVHVLQQVQRDHLQPALRRQQHARRRHGQGLEDPQGRPGSSDNLLVGVNDDVAVLVRRMSATVQLAPEPSSNAHAGQALPIGHEDVHDLRRGDQLLLQVCGYFDFSNLVFYKMKVDSLSAWQLSC